MIRAAAIIMLVLSLTGCNAALDACNNVRDVGSADVKLACDVILGVGAGVVTKDFLKEMSKKMKSPATNGEDMAERWRKFCATTENPQDFPECAPNGETKPQSETK